ncbi:MAG: DUF3043 domain-containing protein [Micrococcaceae bacterium]
MSENLNQKGKGRPTPTRKEREAARKRPLIPEDRKEAKKQARKQSASERMKVRDGIARGDTRYLPERDKGPQRKFVRDFVDARFNVGEITMVVSLILLMLSILFMNNASVSETILGVIWFFILATAVDSFYLGFKVKRLLKDKFGQAERGTSFYASGRALQMRRLRLPKPQVERGPFIGRAKKK